MKDMGLNDRRDEALEFMNAIGVGEEHVPKIFSFLDEELASLKESVGDEEKLCHQVYDVLFLLFELAGRFDLDLDSEWNEGRQRKQLKYLRNMGLKVSVT